MANCHNNTYLLFLYLAKYVSSEPSKRVYKNDHKEQLLKMSII